MTTGLSEWSGLVVAALGGAAIGVERQRSGHASGTNAHLGGVRRFTLLGGLAGLAGWLAVAGWVGIGLVFASGAVALVVVLGTRQFKRTSTIVLAAMMLALIASIQTLH
jgi:hypothetical protein